MDSLYIDSLPKDILEEIGLPIMAFHPVTSELVFANAAARAAMGNPLNINYSCFSHITNGTTASCPAYMSVPLGIPNRDKFDFDVRKLLGEGESGTIVYLNIKGFNAVNHEIGFNNANQVLKDIATHFRDNLPIQNAVYYNKNDKFLFILKDSAMDEKEEAVKGFLSALISSFDQGWSLQGMNFPLASDVAFINFPEYGATVSELIDNVSSAIFLTKNGNLKNTIIEFDSTLREKLITHSEIVWSLTKAIGEGCHEFDVYFQPIVDTTTFKWIGCEALVRWNSEDLGFMLPKKFLSVAEDCNLIGPLSSYVLTKAMSQIEELELPKDNNFLLSCNISPDHLRTMDMIDDLHSIIQSTGFNSKNLVLEIGDLSDALKGSSIVKRNIHRLNELGCIVALDDFAIESLELYDFTDQKGMFKIGKSIIQNLDDDFNDTFLTTVTDLADALDIVICAKAVEDQHQLDKVLSHNIKLAQGYFFHKALEFSDFKAKFEAQR